MPSRPPRWPEAECLHENERHHPGTTPAPSHGAASSSKPDTPAAPTADAKSSIPIHRAHKTPATALTAPGNGRPLRRIDMPDRTCTVDGCDRKHLARGYCMTHYHRMREHGSVELPPRRPRPKIIRQCKIDDCQKQARSLGLCEMHYTRLTRTGDPLTTKTQARGKGPANHNWVGDRVSYIGAHCRVKRERGSARRHACTDCGGPAVEWSYNHADPNELHDADRNCTYSASIEFYEPRCKSCHNRFDQRTERTRIQGRYAPRAS